METANYSEAAVNSPKKKTMRDCRAPQVAIIHGTIGHSGTFLGHYNSILLLYLSIIVLMSYRYYKSYVYARETHTPYTHIRSATCPLVANSIYAYGALFVRRRDGTLAKSHLTPYVTIRYAEKDGWDNGTILSCQPLIGPGKLAFTCPKRRKPALFVHSAGGASFWKTSSGWFFSQTTRPVTGAVEQRTKIRAEQSATGSVNRLGQPGRDSNPYAYPPSQPIVKRQLEGGCVAAGRKRGVW